MGKYAILLVTVIYKHQSVSFNFVCEAININSDDCKFVVFTYNRMPKFC